jgi:REP element-mobilizing transposase RayT
MFQRHPLQNDELMMVTTNTLNRVPVFADPVCAREAIECLYRLQAVRSFHIHAFVVMPDHCHFLLRVLSPYTISRLMNAYKSGLVFDIGIPKLWQPRFHIRIIERNVGRVLDYIHMNPVKKSLCERPEHYPWSSACGKWDVSEFGPL